MVMDARTTKLALARQKLTNHQKKKLFSTCKDDTSEEQCQNAVQDGAIEHVKYENCTENMDTAKVDANLQAFGEADVNVTEILITSKRNLELQINELQSKAIQLENNYTLAINNNSNCKQDISYLECQFKSLQDKYLEALKDISVKENNIADLNNVKSKINDENINLQDQLEFTKSLLSAKETEILSLHNQVNYLQNQLDSMQLQLQQISGAQDFDVNQGKNSVIDPDDLLQKNVILEQQLKKIQKERDQINFHYEQYVGELNEQLKLTATKNSELSLQVQNLSLRETNLIDHISDMEIRIQQMKQQQQPFDSYQVANLDVQNKHDTELNEVQHKYENIQEQFNELNKKYEELQVKYNENEGKLQELRQRKEYSCEHDNMSISKLTADITSDKLAAQRATEQNKKLKVDLEELEKAFVKISRDKLELTEKVAAEKFLNRELTIKLAEAEGKSKDFQIKLLAKDEEMIRLQNSYHELEKDIGTISERNKFHEVKVGEGKAEILINYDNEICTQENVAVNSEACQHNLNIEIEHQCSNDKQYYEITSKLPKEDALIKLQDRFFTIMDEVANLSDEKHRLEHIILQLQNETDTICEYVALYQQQRSLLKKRDEERSAQIKIFQTECELLKSQLEELSGIIIRLAQDTELAIYFQTEPRCSDLAKVMKLLTNLKSNTLIDPYKTNYELKNFHPCGCCSGQLIEL